MNFHPLSILDRRIGCDFPPVGAIVRSGFWLFLSIWLGGVLSLQSSYAAQPDSKPFAVVWRIDGEIYAEGVNGKRLLHQGDKVVVGDRVVAGAAAEGVLKTEDAGYIAIRPGAEFTAKQFVAEGKPTDTSKIELVKGGLRVITGWIGKVNRQGNTLSTPTAVIGIRGTDHEPFVLPDEDENATRFKPGTYDKVNQGGTTLEAVGQSVDIDPGKVGFARSVGKSRALLTLLFPVLLEKIPGFYVPGKFDPELDELAKTVQASIQSELQVKRSKLAKCVPNDIAKQWINELDGHIVAADAPTILSMFAPDVRVKASVRSANGKMTEIELAPNEFADSIVSAVSSLRNYKHRRITIDGKAGGSGSGCGSIAVKSIVIEEGRQAGKPYRFESEETYLLEQSDDQWRAVQAQTRQR